MLNNKRGVGQGIDWILGLGLFIISITFIFVLFRPGISPVYDADTLLDIVQDGFINDSSWEITFVPVFVYPSNETFPSGVSFIELSNRKINVSCSGCGVQASDELTRLLEDKNKLNIEVYYIARQGGDTAPDVIGEDPGDVELGEDEIEDACESYEVRGRRGFGTERDDGACENPSDVIYAARENISEAREPFEELESKEQVIYNLSSDDILTIPTILESGSDDVPSKLKYLITISDKPINFFLNNITENDVPLSACAKVGSDDWPYPLAVAAECPVIYELGLKESIIGIDLPSFINLNNVEVDGCTLSSYDCIKEEWNFPASRDFIITVENLPITLPGDGGGEFRFTFPRELDRPDNVNIFVRQFNGFVLTDDTTRLPVKVRIETW